MPALPEVLTHVAHCEVELINNRNQLVKFEIDERLLQRQVLKPTVGTVADMQTKLGELQKKIKFCKEIIAFLEEMRVEYAKKAEQKAVS